MFRRHAEDLRYAAGEALEARVVVAVGVGLRFAAVDEWLAASLAEPALKKRVLLAQTGEEYHELVHFMEAGDCVWVQVGEDDWAADKDLAESGTRGKALRLTHSPDGSVMSDMEEALARGLGIQGGDTMNTRLHGLGDGTAMQRSVDVLHVRVLFAGTSGGTR